MQSHVSSAPLEINRNFQAVHQTKTISKMPSLNPTHIDDAQWRHGNVILDPDEGVRIHYIDCPAAPLAPTAKPRRPILLIHGFPSTSYFFRHVITPLSEAGYRVIAPDYRGAGESSRPRNGYDKVTVATDLFKLIHHHLGIETKIHVVGQDIGGMVAHAYASRFPQHTASVVWGECPLPGSTPYERLKTLTRYWHFTFHAQTDLPEALVDSRDKVRMYVKHFYDRLCLNPNAITSEDLDHYATMFAQPGGMRCGFDLYRAFPQDAKDNRELLEREGKCKVPACNLNGDASAIISGVAQEQTSEFYEDAEILAVEQSGHWTPEENPSDFVRKVVGFVSKYD